ncbi:MAG: S-layer homology domain-containing protein [Clostridia bacterium]|nr:S-layer homology domain-containing protein [Clostridia bacterium]
MKRKIAFFLTVVMLCTAMLPVQVFAAKDKVLEGIVAKVKKTFSIPGNYTFSPEAYSENGKKVWNLRWSSKDGDEASIYVRVDEKGTILSYDNWKPYDYSTKKKLPKFSRQEAKAKAEGFIKKINADAFSQVRVSEINNQPMMESNYYFNFDRMVNGIPFYNNNIGVSVNSETGEVQSYYYNWNDGLVFPDKAKAINLDAAKKAYIEKLGLRLVYRYNYENEKLSLFAVYTPKYGSSYAIDALSGDKVQFDPYYGDGYGGGGIVSTIVKDEMVQGANLTPEEIAAIDELSDLISQEAAEKIAREFDKLKLTSEFKLSGANLSRNWPLRDEYTWSLNFHKEATKPDGSGYVYINAGINAKTGEITSFSRSVNNGENAKAKFTEEQAKQAVEEFLKSFKADKLKDVEFDDSNSFYYPLRSGSEEQTYFNFNYTRKVNGAYFPDNKLTIGFDAVSGEVTSFNMNWFDTEFPTIDKKLDISKVYEKLFSVIGLELQYKAKYPYDFYYKGVMPESSKLDVKLVYALKPGKPEYFDVNTGVLLDYNGKPYKENKPVVYTDIKGHSAEKQITVLSEYGVSLEGPKFRPNENITQLDFLNLLSKTMNYYYGPVVSSSSSKDDIDNLYKFLIREGVVKEAEKKASAAVTREEAVKFIIRAMKYDKVADIKGIYKCSFKDANKINPDLLGYVSIAQGLKIVTGSTFNPKSKLTRAQTAVMIYNYLQG